MICWLRYTGPSKLLSIISTPLKSLILFTFIVCFLLVAEIRLISCHTPFLKDSIVSFQRLLPTISFSPLLANNLLD